jgi:mono/diheme cytochrome c family protein
MPFVAYYHTHKLVVLLFILIYLVKTILLLLGNQDRLNQFKKFIKVPEIVISILFLVTGGVMLLNLAEFNTLFLIKLTIVLAAIPVAVIAFSKNSKMLAVLSIIMLISAYGVAEMYRASFAKRNEVKIEIADATATGYDLKAHGKALFEAQCHICHGADGKANIAGAKDLTISQKSEDEIAQLIKKGKNAMPAMESIYSEDEIKALVHYVISLR